VSRGRLMRVPGALLRVISATMLLEVADEPEP
jgi:hypothetical protein